MLSKEEIEKAKNNLWNFLEDVWFGSLYSQEEMQQDLRVLLNEYNYLETMNERKQNRIAELETREQKLIDKLEEIAKNKKSRTDCRYCNNTCDSYAVCKLCEEILSIIKLQSSKETQ